MLFPDGPMTGSALIEAIFEPEDVPEARLFRRLEATGAGILRAMLAEGDERPQDLQRAERRGASPSSTQLRHPKQVLEPATN
jgi:hypothetical protein